MRKILEIVLILMAGTLALAAEGPRPTDEAFRNSSNAKAGNDYDRELLGDPANADDSGRREEELQKKLQKELGAAAQREDEPKAPLLLIAEEMREVPPRLERRDSGAVTQHLQRQIVSDLEKLIEEAKKSGARPGNPSNGRGPTGNGLKEPARNPGQPAGDSQPPAKESDPNIHRTPQQVRDEAAEMARKQMIELFHAELQQRNPDQKIELPSEYFLPGYELEIEDYFRRLSQDHPDTGRP